MPTRTQTTTELIPVKRPAGGPHTGTKSVTAVPSVPDDLSTKQNLVTYLDQLYAQANQGDVAAAIIPWAAERLKSDHSRRAYAQDVRSFVEMMRGQEKDPLQITGDDIRLYAAAMLEGGASQATVARMLSVLRGTYRQFGKHGLMPWEQVQDIQNVESPRVEKNTTPALTEKEACDLLHAPDRSKLVGIRDYAMLFTFFRTAGRCSAIAGACVGNIHREGTNYYLLVKEKGRKKEKKALLEAAPAIFEYIEAAGIADDLDGPLFRPIANNKKEFLRLHLTRDGIRKVVQKYAAKAGIQVKRVGGRGVAVHSLRKTTITNALQHGAKMEQVQALAGHADIRTTQLYFAATGKEAEEAARHVQIR